MKGGFFLRLEQNQFGQIGAALISLDSLSALPSLFLIFRRFFLSFPAPIALLHLREGRSFASQEQHPSS
jgi:hypothetical protein